ncbi:hypothetical protein M2113_001469 [Aurantimicrobium minutum]|uniref:transglutaminase domain-containing protein n=1 Tax=Aurantimicrobium minutum TaxID=708131 RepID=UPI002475B0DE|nr:transglutaminase domain-containing protein [Aurantimicrobium minutum]MDH6410483.1 hypothetical protein [Aurantimicrobium minutum]
MSARVTEQSRKFTVVTGIFVAGFVLLGTLMAWPIYQTPYLFVTMLIAGGCAAALAWFFAFRNWSWFRVLILSAGGFLVVGLPATNPSALTSLPSALTGWLNTVSGVVFGWKQLVTITLPVGTYQSLLVPYFIVLFCSTLFSLIFVWTRPRAFWAVVPLMFSTVIFAIAFGALEVRTSIKLFGITLPVSPGMVAGFAILALAVAYMNWGIAHTRSVNLSAADFGAMSAQSRNRRLRRTAVKVGVFVGASVIVFALISAMGISPIRQVLRSAVDPTLDIKKEVSPLSIYREAFTDPTLYSAKWLSFSGEGALPERIRLAVLPYYDGQVFRVVSDGGELDENSAFSRVPTDLQPDHNGGALTEFTVTVGDNSNIWMPTTAGLTNVSFEGQNQADLTNGFFYNRASEAGVVIPRMSAGDRYVLKTYAGSENGSLASATPDEKNVFNQDLIPESLTTWVQQQGVNFDGKGLETLIKRLRARGYLSHALSQPSPDAGESSWTAGLPGYNFKPSLAGHSTGRIGDLFTQLVDKQKQASDQTNDALLVAAVGDDEQFAAAAALLANYIGFPARVVVGFHTVDTKQDGYVIPACENGECTGANLSAWVEIQTDDGWIAVDTTPQYKNQIAPETQDRQDPQNATQVDPTNADALPPPAANPANGDAGKNKNNNGLDLSWLFDLLKNLLAGLLIIAVILSPFALIIGSKIHRRRLRRNNEDSTLAIAGAWEEFVDSAIDHGYPLPKAQTRSELVKLYELPSALPLAELTDVAVFGPKTPTDRAVTEAWTNTEALRAEFTQSSTRVQQVVALLSLKSFVRYFGPQTLEGAKQGITSLAQGQANAAGNSVRAFGAFFMRQINKLRKR